MEKIFRCSEVNITHKEMVQLRKTGLLELGMDDSFAMQIANTKGVGPKKSTAKAAYHFWNWIAFGAFAYTVYLSFTEKWWWFIVGLITMSVIGSTNKTSNSENLLEDAMVDAEFYDRVRSIGGWLYKMEETTVSEYLSNENSIE